MKNFANSHKINYILYVYLHTWMLSDVAVLRCFQVRRRLHHHRLLARILCDGVDAQEGDRTGAQFTADR